MGSYPDSRIFIYGIESNWHLFYFCFIELVEEVGLANNLGQTYLVTHLRFSSHGHETSLRCNK